MLLPTKLLAGCALLLATSDATAPVKTDSPRRPALTPPPAMREFRAAWVATVDNIDWPSKRGLPAEQQKAELIAILNKAVDLRLNAIVLQVRPCCDALYPSKLEPWSEYLSGQMGKPPVPNYDPLEFAVSEAHRRGLELHAWFNPYRASHPSMKGALSEDHISNVKPEIAKKYGPYLWLDPSEKATQNHSRNVILDVVKRYDVDGVHIDDYFYPYKVKDKEGNVVDFPDEPSWKKYVAGGGTLSRDDFRRNSVDTFIEQLYVSIKKTRKDCKFGISPFGIWRPGNPPQIKGYDQYADLYADAKKWLQKGWLDYWTPQLYWRIDPPQQSYPVLLKWWVEQNQKGRHVWVGNYTGRVGSGGGWSAWEIANQIKLTRDQAGATGNVHFSMKTLMTNVNGISDVLKGGVYRDQALVPASTWLADGPPEAPKVTQQANKLTVEPKGKVKCWQWVVQTKRGATWSTKILPAMISEIVVEPDVEAVAISAVERNGLQSKPVVVERQK